MNITAKASSGKYKDLPEGDNTEYLDKADQSGFLILNKTSRVFAQISLTRAAWITVTTAARLASAQAKII